MKEEREKTISLEYEIVVTDKEGKEIHKIEKRPAKSYVKQFLQALRVFLAQTTVSMKDTSGNSVNVNPKPTGYYTSVKADAGDSDDSYGIQVGTGDAAVTNNDYALDNKIAHGSGAGQLQYGATSFYDIIEDGGYIKFTISRTFFNASGASIDVKEIGLVGYLDATTEHWGNFLLIRDVLASAVTVDSGNTLTVQYTLKTTA